MTKEWDFGGVLVLYAVAAADKASSSCDMTEWARAGALFMGCGCHCVTAVLTWLTAPAVYSAPV